MKALSLTFHLDFNDIEQLHPVELSHLNLLEQFELESIFGGSLQHLSIVMKNDNSAEIERHPERFCCSVCNAAGPNRLGLDWTQTCCRLMLCSLDKALLAQLKVLQFEYVGVNKHFSINDALEKVNGNGHQG